jgi:site-specific recombinase XerD
MSSSVVTLYLKDRSKKSDATTNVKGKKEELAFIYVRVTVNRKRSLISTKVKVFPSQWDKHGQKIINHPSRKQLNVTITNKLNQVLKSLNKREMEEVHYTAESIKNTVVGKDRTNIFVFAETYASEVGGKREQGTITNYGKHMRKLEVFVGSKELTFEEVDVDFLNRYESFLRKQVLEYKKGSRPLNNNYVHLLMRTFRKMFNAAKIKGLTSNYPFDAYEFPSVKPPMKDYLSIDEMKLFEELVETTANKSWKQAGIYLLFGCYTGLRISDWKLFNPATKIVENGKRILLRAKKNGEWVGMKISNPLQRNLKRMEATPLTMEEQTINEKLKEIAGDLKIKKKLTTHSGRHSFAITLCAELGISVESCAELMGITVKTCIDNYYRVSRVKLDNATDAAWNELK